VIQDDRTARLRVSGVPGPAVLTFKLNVTDSLGQQHSDTTSVTVKAPMTGSAPISSKALGPAWWTCVDDERTYG
jgi:hypothetical protein